MKAWPSSLGFVALVFFLLCLPLVLSTRAGGYADDEDLYHLPAVRQIRAHWPALDLNRDALSAVSPGYAYVLATVSLVTGPSRLALRGVTWGLSLALLVLLWRAFPAATAGMAAASVLPLACSNFFVKSASWIVTDNPALLCVAGALTMVFLRPGLRDQWLGGLSAGAATFLRQVHVWAAVPLGLRAVQEIRANPHSRWRVRALLPALIPLGVLGLLAARWHGLVPLAWQSAVALQGGLPVTPLCYLLAVFFLLGVFYQLALPPENPWIEACSRPVLAAGALGLVVALVGPTNYDVAAGRWGGYLWSATPHLPVVGQRSVLFVILTPLGAALLAVMSRRLARQSGAGVAWLWLGSFLAWAATSLSNRLVFHRYFEPTILVFLIFWSLLLLRSPVPSPAIRPVRLYALAVGQGLITLATAHYQTYGQAFLAGR
jgi:hypothetical protein